MLKHGIRLSIAILTFAIGVALLWPLKLVQRLETALVDRFYDVSDSVLRPISLTADPSADANEIYRLLVQRQVPSNDELKVLVLQSQTTTFKMFVDDSLVSEWQRPDKFHELMKELMPEAEMQTLDNYILRNMGPEQLKVWNLGINCVVATDSELLDHKLGDFWTSFYKKYPNSAGLVSFSNVGFNDRHDQALVYVSRACGYTCGEGAYVLLRKVKGKWEIQIDQGLWVS